MNEQPITSFKDLRVWQEAMSLAETCYSVTRSFPTDERFGLISQIRRAAQSVPANIAEGFGRDSTGAYIQFLRVAQGSLKEIETHLLLAVRVGVMPGISAEIPLDKCQAVGRMLRKLIRVLQEKRK